MEWSDPEAAGFTGARVVCNGEFTAMAGTEQYTVTGLDNGKEYSVYIYAIYSDGSRSPGLTQNAIPGCVVIRSNPRNYHVSIRYTVQNDGRNITRMGVCFPLAFSNQYQIVRNQVLTHAYGHVVEVAASENRYLRYRIEGDEVPASGETLAWGWDCDLTMYDVTTDFDAITTLYPYDTTTELYQRYTAGRGVWIDLEHPTIVSKSAELMTAAGGDYLEYARLCGNWVVEYLTYQSPHANTSLADIITSRLGDCGCHSGLVVALLRRGGVPARMILARKPDTGHAWLELYLERYGWIPYEVTYEDSPPGPGLGTKQGSYLLVSTDQEQALVFFDDFSWTASVLQSGYMRYWYSGAGGSVTGGIRSHGKTEPAGA